MAEPDPTVCNSTNSQFTSPKFSIIATVKVFLLNVVVPMENYRGSVTFPKQEY